MTAVDPPARTARTAGQRSAARTVVALVLLVPFLWELLGAVSNLLAWLGLAAALQQQLTLFAWLVLLTGVAIPVVAYALALLVARRRTAASLARALVVAFCASEALTLSVLAYFETVVGSR